MAFTPSSYNSPTLAILRTLEQQKKDQDLEDQLARWEKPASDSEEDMIQRAARMVREALSADPWFDSEGVVVEPQGSYHNNTNVRQKADMDLRIVHQDLCVLTAHGVDYTRADRELGYRVTGRQNPQTAAFLRNKIALALTSKFGQGNVDPGNRSFRVKEVPGSRSDIDVVPALTLHYVYEGQATLLSPSRLYAVKGVMIYGRDGSETLNFPERHYDNGVSKRSRTTHRFKKVVRSLKSLRDWLVSQQMLGPKDVPSFLIECMVYRVEDEYFRHDELRAARLRRVLGRIQQLLNDPVFVSQACEINDVKLLFHNQQPWTVDKASAFVRKALRYLEI